MTIDESIAFERQQAKDRRNEYYTFGIQKSKEAAEEHEQRAEWLKDLKEIKEMDLSIPQHFTKEQSDWIKSYCIRKNLEFYNKAIDDFAKRLKAKCRKCYVDCDPYGSGIEEDSILYEDDIDEIAEQLKEQNR